MMIDKAKYIEHIKDKEQHIVMRKLLDNIESVLKYHDIESTDFLNPYQVKLARSILNRFDISYIEEGGLDDSERKSIVIYPSYMIEEDIENPIKAVKIEGSFKFNNVSHRDYLGSILGLGIRREKIGDINIYEDCAILIIHNDLLEFVIYNLKNIGKESVKLKEVDIDNIQQPVEKYRDIQVTVSSLRLDAVISEVCNISRSKASSQIAQNKIKVNWQPILNHYLDMHDGDMISVRGFGRFKILKELGETKKGRIRIVVRIYE